MKRIKKVILTLFVLIMMLCLFTGCDKCDEFNFHIPTFEEKCVTTEDGFVYYPIENEAYIIKIPETEEVTIPEYIDGKKVVQLGYRDQGLGYMKDYWIDGRHVKQLTIQHDMNYYLTNFTNVETFICINPIVSLNLIKDEIAIIDNSWSIFSEKLKTIVLKFKENAVIPNNAIKEIYVNEVVKVIEDGVFDGLEGVTIKTSYESKPDGWEDGWNGTCAVEWGVGMM